MTKSYKKQNNYQNKSNYKKKKQIQSSAVLPPPILNDEKRIKNSSRTDMTNRAPSLLKMGI